MAKDVIIACDFPTKEDTLRFLRLFPEDTKPFVKIGMELFYSEGPDIVKAVKDLGLKIFLDLKLHDIPNTVENGMRSLAKLGVDMTNVHASGGIKMMEAGLRGLTEGPGERREEGPEKGPGSKERAPEGKEGDAPLLIAVTQLTSTSQETMNDELLIDGKIEDVVTKYAGNARKAGLAGVVCSPLEAGLIHEHVGQSFLTVTPGVRFADSDVGDQARVTTPERARELGSDYIVVGRPITKADDPVLAYEKCVTGFLG